MVSSRILTTNQSQTVYLPQDVQFDKSVTEVNIRVNRQERIITPVNAVWDSFFLNGPVASDDFLDDRPGLLTENWVSSEPGSC